MRQLHKNTKDAAPAEPDPAHTRGALPSGASRTPRTATGIGSCASLGEVLPPSLRRRQRRLCPPPSGSGSPRSPPRGTRGRSGKGRARPGARRAGTDTRARRREAGAALKVTPRGGGSRRRGTRHDMTQHTIRYATPRHAMPPLAFPHRSPYCGGQAGDSGPGAQHPPSRGRQPPHSPRCRGWGSPWSAARPAAAAGGSERRERALRAAGAAAAAGGGSRRRRARCGPGAASAPSALPALNMAALGTLCSGSESGRRDGAAGTHHPSCGLRGAVPIPAGCRCPPAVPRPHSLSWELSLPSHSPLCVPVPQDDKGR